MIISRSGSDICCLFQYSQGITLPFIPITYSSLNYCLTASWKCITIREHTIEQWNQHLCGSKSIPSKRANFFPQIILHSHIFSYFWMFFDSNETKFNIRIRSHRTKCTIFSFYQLNKLLPREIQKPFHLQHVVTMTAKLFISPYQYP